MRQYAKTLPHKREGFIFKLSSALGDALLGACIGTETATDAEGLIDACEEVCNGDSAVGTSLLALHTADAACLTNLHSSGTLIVVAAVNSDSSSLGNDLDDLVRTGLGAESAADASSGIDMSDTVFDADSVLGTYSSAVTKAETAVGTSALTAKEHFSGLAGSGAAILILILSLVAGTAAAHVSSHGNNFPALYAENSCDVLSSVSAAGNTKVSSNTFAGNKSLSVSIASGKSACATVCAGQALTNGAKSLVNRNSHNLGCDGKKNSAYKTDNGNYHDSDNNSIHTGTSLTQKSVNDTGKAHERNGHDGGCSKSDRNALEALGNIACINLGTNTAEQNHSQHVAEACAKGVDHRLSKSVGLGDVEDNNAENCAVGGYKRQEDTEGRIQRRYELLEEHLNKLYECSDNENENDGLKIA